jgi:hypothetical protein
METRRQVVLLVIALSAVALGPATVQAQVDQRALAQQILNGSARERSRAVEEARALGPQNTGPELRAALIAALEREGQLEAQRYHADLRGQTLEPPELPEFIFRLSGVVAELQDPAAIPALVGVLGTGSPVTNALVAFGEEAVPAILAAVRSPETTHYVVDGALIALRFMVEGAGPHPRSASTLNEIRSAAKQRLIGKQYFTTVWSAIDLAVALKDPDLRRIVDSLASDRNAVVARGIEGAETIEETQRRAADRLAGVPPKPRRP